MTRLRNNIIRITKLEIFDKLSVNCVCEIRNSLKTHKPLNESREYTVY